MMLSQNDIKGVRAIVVGTIFDEMEVIAEAIGDRVLALLAQNVGAEQAAESSVEGIAAALALVRAVGYTVTPPAAADAE